MYKFCQWIGTNLYITNRIAGQIYQDLKIPFFIFSFYFSNDTFGWKLLLNIPIMNINIEMFAGEIKDY